MTLRARPVSAFGLRLRLLALGGCALVLSATSVSTPRAAGDRPAPVAGARSGVVIWAWERPADLRALDPRVGVAFHAQTLVIDAGVVQVKPRRHPLRVAPAARLTAVTRIESVGGVRPDVTQLASAADAILRTSRAPQVVAVQIDYDATAGERAFYRRLLDDVRRRLSPGVSLSITALASWCVGDPWIRGLPVDEIVPMLFRMGPDGARFAGIAARPDAAAAECRAAIGTSLDEPLAVRREGRRWYVFNADAWTAASLRHIEEAGE